MDEYLYCWGRGTGDRYAGGEGYDVIASFKGSGYGGGDAAYKDGNGCGDWTGNGDGTGDGLEIEYEVRYKING